MPSSFVTPWTVAHQASLSMGFPRQEYWSSCHFLLQGIFLTQRSNSCLLHWQVDSLVLSYQESPMVLTCGCREGSGTPLQYSSTPAWKSPWTEEPERLQSMGSLRLGHDWATSLSLFTFMHWRRKWQPTPVFLPGESQGQGSLVGCRPLGRTESDTTEAT